MLKMKNIFLIFLFFLNNSFADDFLDGARLFENKDYIGAYKLWVGLAGQGNTSAQVNVGNLYAKGLGVEKNLNEAFRWLNMAAEKGDINAQNSIGEMYLLGNGLLKDITKADMWFTIASNNGNKIALENKTLLEKQMSEEDKLIVKNNVLTCMNQMLQNCN